MRMNSPDPDPAPETADLLHESKALQKQVAELSATAKHVEERIKRLEADALLAKAKRKKSGIFESETQS